MKALESFEFIYVLITLQRSLLYLKEATVKLQGQNQDIVYGVTTIQRCFTELKTLRADIDLYSHRIFEHSCRVAERSGITVTMPRVSQRQQHRPNPQSYSVEDYFKYPVTIPFLDHLISDLSSRFDVHTKRAASLQGLLPTKITADSSVCDIQEAVTFYTDDLPHASIIDEEFHIWKSRWLSVPPKDRPQTLSESLRQCCPQSLPNIFVLLKLFATLPLSSCSCERSASALRRLNNYLRCTQTEERLTALALIMSLQSMSTGSANYL